MKIAVIGHALVDYIYQVEGIPGFDDEYRILQEGKYPGGSALNTAVGLRKLGSDPLLIANVGTDDRGIYLAKFIEEEGIILNGVKTIDGETGYCIVVRDVKGNVLILSKLNVAEPLNIGDERMELFNEVDHVHLTSLSMESFRNILGTLGNIGLNFTLSWDIGRVTAKQGWESIKHYLRYFKILFLSLRELEHVFRDRVMRDISKELRNYFKGVLIVKKGRKGVAIYTEDGRVIEAYVAQPVIVKDSLGAGDAFASCYIHYSLKGFDEEEVARRCVVFAALKVGYEGGSSMPSFYELEKGFKSLSEKVVVKNLVE